jgi:hypothetical protein
MPQPDFFKECLSRHHPANQRTATNLVTIVTRFVAVMVGMCLRTGHLAVANGHRLLKGFPLRLVIALAVLLFSLTQPE